VHLVPEAAVVQRTPRRTLADMRRAVRTMTPAGLHVLPFGEYQQGPETVAVGCGSLLEGDPRAIETGPSQLLSTSRRQRRELHGSNPGDCNNSTNFFCWMSCFDIPEADNAADYVHDGWSLYCLDPSVLSSSSNVTLAVQPCTENGIMGAAMNPICTGKWQKSVAGLPGVPIAVNATLPTHAEPFCYGATSMYMNGFNVSRDIPSR
jgi:hypothetical protein